MSTRIITFRCPLDLLDRVQKLAVRHCRTRNTVLLTAMRLFARQLREQREGQITSAMPPESLTGKVMFPHPEKRGGRPCQAGYRNPFG